MRRCRRRSSSVRGHLFNLHGEQPDIEQEHNCGETIEYEDQDDRSQVIVDRRTAGTEGLTFYGLTYAGAEPVDPIAGYEPVVRDTPFVTVHYSGAAANPLRVSPGIDMWATIVFDRNEGTLHVTGAVDEFPAFEGYAMKNEDGRPFTLFQFDAGESPTELVGGASRGFDVTVELGSSG